MTLVDRGLIGEGRAATEKRRPGQKVADKAPPKREKRTSLPATSALETEWYAPTRCPQCGKKGRHTCGPMEWAALRARQQPE